MANIGEPVDTPVPDLIAPDLAVLFCGINPGLVSAAVGHHFARRGNRFWKVLHLAGFTAVQLEPDQEQRLLDAGCGITNLVARASAMANELSRDELRAGARRLGETVRTWRPRHLAVLGVGAYRIAFDEPRAEIGRQPHPFEGATRWVLPNPSGAQAHYQLPALVALFAELAAAAHEETAPGGS